MQKHNQPPPQDDQRRPTTTPTTQPTTNYDPNYRNNAESTGEEEYDALEAPYRRNLPNSSMADDDRRSGQSAERPSEYDTDDLIEDEGDDLLLEDEDVDDMDMAEENTEQQDDDNDATRPNRPQRPDIYADGDDTRPNRPERPDIQADGDGGQNPNTQANQNTEGGQGYGGAKPTF